MKRCLIACVSIILFQSSLTAQNRSSVVNKNEIRHIERVLSADSMQGRKIFTPGIKKARIFVADCFEKAGLKKWSGDNDYLQAFNMVTALPDSVSIKWNGKMLPSEHLVEISTQKKIHWRSGANIKVDSLKTREDIQKKLRQYFRPKQNALVWISSDFKKVFASLQRYFSKNIGFENRPTTLFVLADEPPKQFDIHVINHIEKKETANVLGYLPGTSKPDEYVIFSAHYDHLGVDTTLKGDQIYNGANDDASGTTAVIALARYFAMKGGNARSLIFVAFTAEEEGGYGSRYFSEHLNPDKIIAMFNIEMIGTLSKWGENSAYITGFQYTDFGEILQKNLKESKFKFYPDPYPKQNLFYRSDNATLARLGVPAHTISTSQMDKEPHYHKVSDEIGTLDIGNMAEIIRAIAVSSESIVNGTDTPTRVKQSEIAR